MFAKERTAAAAAGKKCRWSSLRSTAHFASGLAMYEVFAL
jgi:hypothetical protein